MCSSVYLENPRGESYASNEPEVTGKYLEAFWALEDQALLDNMSQTLRQVAAHTGEGSTDLALASSSEGE